jgi:predicted metal-binding membrane protein
MPLGVGIFIVLSVCWAYLIAMAWGMENMDVSVDWLLMPAMSSWGSTDLVLVFIMWTLMMAAMMLPSAVPLLLLLFRINSANHSRRGAVLAVAVFALGYLAVWAGFSVLATFAQWGLLKARLVSPMMDSSSVYFSGVLLLAAGAYQFSTLKNVCLTRCRSPLSVLMTQRSQGRWGAFVMGLRQGMYCTGCCWLLMALLFVLGVMNLLWIIGLTVFVLFEKVLRQPRWFVHASGAILLVWGVWVLGQKAFA